MIGEDLIDLGGQVAVVTGAGQGAGRATAIELAKHNCGGVAVNDYVAEKAEAVAEEIRAMGVPADRTVVHAAWSPGDVDCFALPVADAPRALSVLVDTPAEADLSAEIVLGGKVVASSAQPGKGAAERVTATIPAGATAVLRVKGSDKATAAAGEGGYDIKLEEGTPGAPGAP